MPKKKKATGKKAFCIGSGRKGNGCKTIVERPNFLCEECKRRNNSVSVKRGGGRKSVCSRQVNSN